MYYPYFRGKQYDLLALIELSQQNLLSKAICPIIEPVKNSVQLKKFIQEFEANGQPYFVIENPEYGDFLTEAGTDQLRSLTQSRARILDCTLEELEDALELVIAKDSTWVSLSDWQNNQRLVVTPYEFRILNQLQGPLIISDDPFTRLPSSQSYQELPEEAFSERLSNYQKLGFAGFSDYSIDTRYYSERGYPSRFLSVHLVYPFEGEVRIRHFLSIEELPTQKDKSMQMMEEVEKWQAELGESVQTYGLQRLLDAAKAEKFPGMGNMRKAAVMHHLEIMSKHLTAQAQHDLE
ncbi:MAG: sce7725 family protein [Enterococcus sp.]